MHVEQIDGQPNLGYWIDPNDRAEWACRLSRPGAYRAHAEAAGPSGSGFVLKLGEQEIEATLPATGGFNSFQTVELGVIQIPKVGDATASVTPIAGQWNAINLRRIVLLPIAE